MADGLYQAIYDQGKPNWLTWSDVHGDGKMSMDGVRYVEDPPLLDDTTRVSEIQLMPDLSFMMLIPFRVKGADDVVDVPACRRRCRRAGCRFTIGKTLRR